jgi:hypothetical protein
VVRPLQVDPGGGAAIATPGGELAFYANSALVTLCVPELESDGPATDRLLRPYFGMHRYEWPDTDGVEFHLNHGDWVRLLRSSGFEIVDLVEPRAPQGAATRYDWADAGWARRWPTEEGWRARKRA